MAWRSCCWAARPAGWLSYWCLVLLALHHLAEAELQVQRDHPRITTTTMVSAPWDNIFKSLGNVKIPPTESPDDFGENVRDSLSQIRLATTMSTSTTTQAATCGTISCPHGHEHKPHSSKWASTSADICCQAKDSALTQSTTAIAVEASDVIHAVAKEFGASASLQNQRAPAPTQITTTIIENFGADELERNRDSRTETKLIQTTTTTSAEEASAGRYTKITTQTPVEHKQQGNSQTGKSQDEEAQSHHERHEDHRRGDREGAHEQDTIVVQHNARHGEASTFTSTNRQLSTSTTSITTTTTTTTGTTSTTTTPSSSATTAELPVRELTTTTSRTTTTITTTTTATTRAKKMEISFGNGIKRKSGNPDEDNHDRKEHSSDKRTDGSNEGQRKEHTVHVLSREGHSGTPEHTESTTTTKRTDGRNEGQRKEHIVHVQNREGHSSTPEHTESTTTTAGGFWSIEVREVTSTSGLENGGVQRTATTTTTPFLMSDLLPKEAADTETTTTSTTTATTTTTTTTTFTTSTITTAVTTLMPTTTTVMTAAATTPTRLTVMSRGRRRHEDDRQDGNRITTSKSSTTTTVTTTTTTIPIRVPIGAASTTMLALSCGAISCPEGQVHKLHSLKWASTDAAVCCEAAETTTELLVLNSSFENASLWQRPPSAEYCVVSGSEDGRLGMSECSRLIQTNCSTAEGAAALCPAECPYLELGAYTACGSACVAAAQCGDYRPAFAFANPATHVCEKCPYWGCSSCNQTHCLSCREGFRERTAGDMFYCRLVRRLCKAHKGILGQLCNSACIISPHAGRMICMYDVDDMLEPVYYWIACGGVFLLLIVVSMWSCCCCNSAGVKAGLQHRSRSFVHAADNAGTPFPSSEGEVPLYPLLTNVHKKNIVGVGLALYYNQLVFVALVAALAWGVLYASDLGYSLYGTVRSGGEDFDLQNFVLSGGIEIRQGTCSYLGDEETGAIAYAWRRAVACLALWLVIFPTSIIFAWKQSVASREFEINEKHMFMEDYVVLAKGFPPSATDPLVIQRWVEGILGRTVVGVSIGYDFYAKRKEIKALLDYHIQRRERECGSYVGADEDLVDAPDDIIPGGPAALLRSLESTGDAFIVLRKQGDAEELFRRWEEEAPHVPRLGSFFDFTGHSLNKSLDITYPPELLPQAEDEDSMGFEFLPPEVGGRPHRIQLREVTSEPVSIEWACLGFTRKHIRIRAIVASLVFLASIVAFNLLLYYPLIRYVIRFSRKAGMVPSTIQTLLLGSIIGFGNSLISNVIYLGVPMLGFKRKDQRDVVVFLLRTLLVLWNSVVLTCMTIVKFAAVANPEHGILKGISNSLEISELLGREAALAKALLSLFVSGTFVVPTLGSIFQNPAVLIKDLFLIRSGLLGRRLKARTCEHLLEPMEMWIPWDYASHIQLPCCAFLPLFFSEPVGDCAARVLCAVLVCWCGVMYFVQRIIHLRASKKTFFCTDRLDRAAVFMFALPVAMLLHLTAYWTLRAWQIFEVSNVRDATLVWVISFPANMLGGLMYFQCVKCAMRQRKDLDTKSRVEKTYTEALSQLKYSYFNTNPVYCLMSDFFGMWEKSDSNKRLSKTTYYEIGKVYLQMLDG